ncbi:MAG: peptide MFS transporter [Pseudomonadota bacterium]
MNVVSGEQNSKLTSVEGATFMGHPRGLAYIVFTETWERFSFYGMQALLVLYMYTHLLQPGVIDNVIGFSQFRLFIEGVFGSLSIQAMASQIFGLYIGFVYFTPVIGGWLGDRHLGQQKAVLLGALFMAVGHFLMAFEPLFLFALLALIIGSGLLKGNLAAQVGRLYEKNDQRRDTAYSAYNMSINVGAFVAPLICGTLGEVYGWHYGFGVAGIGMLVGIVIYLRGQKYLPKDNQRGAAGEVKKLQPGDGKAIIAILCLFLIAATYWTAQTQVWNAYPIWIKEEVARNLSDFVVPVTWFQSLDSLSVLLLGPLVIWLWEVQRKKGVEPTDLLKISIGYMAVASAFFWLAGAEILSGDKEVALLWPFLFHFITSFGFLYIAPIMLALVSRAAPEAVNAMMVSSYYLAIFAGSFASGWLGRFYEPMSPEIFWAMHGAIVGGGALLVILFKGAFIKYLRL